MIPGTTPATKYKKKSRVCGAGEAGPGSFFLVLFNQKQRSDLVEVQRGVVAERADGGQLNQGVVLGAFDTFTFLVPEDTRAPSTLCPLNVDGGAPFIYLF